MGKNVILLNLTVINVTVLALKIIRKSITLFLPVPLMPWMKLSLA